MRRPPSLLSATAVILVLGCLRLAHADTSATVTVSGLVYDAESHEVVPYATVQVVGSGQSGLTNADGRYRITASPGSELRFSHIAYYPFQYHKKRIGKTQFGSGFTYFIKLFAISCNYK